MAEARQALTMLEQAQVQDQSEAAAMAAMSPVQAVNHFHPAPPRGVQEPEGKAASGGAFSVEQHSCNFSLTVRAGGMLMVGAVCDICDQPATKLCVQLNCSNSLSLAFQRFRQVCSWDALATHTHTCPCFAAAI